MASLSEEAMQYLRKLLNEAELPSREEGGNFRGLKADVREANAENRGAGLRDVQSAGTNFFRDSALRGATKIPFTNASIKDVTSAPSDADRLTKGISAAAADKSNRMAEGEPGASGIRVPGASVRDPGVDAMAAAGPRSRAAAQSSNGYAADKMAAVRSAMGADQPEPEAAEPAAAPPPPETGGSAPPPSPGKYKAEGDPWTYEVGADGQITVSKDGGEPIPVEPGTKAYNAIAGQVKSGQLKRDTSAFDSAEMMGGGTELDWEG